MTTLLRSRRSHYTNYKTQLNVFRQHSVQFSIQHLLWYLSDMDECSASIPACHASAQCLNTLGSFKCLCPAGFTGGLSTICTGKPSSLKHLIRPCLIWVSVFPSICWGGEGAREWRGGCASKSILQVHILMTTLVSIPSPIPVFKPGHWRICNAHLSIVEPNGIFLSFGNLFCSLKPDKSLNNV